MLKKIPIIQAIYLCNKSPAENINHLEIPHIKDVLKRRKFKQSVVCIYTSLFKNIIESPFRPPGGG